MSRDRPDITLPSPTAPAPGPAESADRTAGASTGAPKVFSVDWADMERHMSARRSRALIVDDRRRTPPPRRRFVTSVDAEAGRVRRNVRDAVRAVLAWLASVTDRSRSEDLEQVLRHCLRPGPDATKLNYSALAQQIERTTGVHLSAKRVRTAIDHLRSKRPTDDAPRPRVMARVDALHETLASHLPELTGPMSGAALSRSVAMDVLAAVRCSAGRLIDNDYGEQIPARVDLEDIEGRLLDVATDLSGGPRTCGLGLHRLLLTLCDYDASAAADMRLVLDGSRVVTALAGAGSLPGLFAQLNVAVAGRDLLDTNEYCRRMLRLAAGAERLHGDPDAKRFLNWMRRLPEDRRLPSPLRLHSYCLNNAATRIFERLSRQELERPDRWLAVARSCLERMRLRDSGFRLIRTTETICRTVVGRMTGDDTEVTEHFATLGVEGSLAVLLDLARFDNCEQIIRAAEAKAVQVHPSLRHQLICVG